MRIIHDRLLKSFETETILGLAVYQLYKRQSRGRINSNGWLPFILHHEALALYAEKIHE